VLLSVPGAFTVSTFKKIYFKKQSVIAAIQPTCHVNHLPSYLQKYDEFVAKGADVVAVLAANDPFVMSGWAGVEGLKDKVINVHFFRYISRGNRPRQILALTDTYAEWSKQLGLDKDFTGVGFGIRTARYAMILDDLVVKYIGVSFCHR